MTIVPNPTDVSEKLREWNNWICWKVVTRDGRETKLPVDPHTGEMASTTDPDTWTNFEKALSTAHKNDWGVGFVFSEEDRFAGVDLDNCRDPETKTLEPWAVDIITRLDSYTHVSPSGTGFHVFVLAIHPGEGNKKGMPRESEELEHMDDPEIEMYDRERFFTFTGDRVDMVSTGVQQRHQEYGEVHDQWIASREETEETVDYDDLDLSDVDGVGGGEIRNDLGIPLSVIRANDDKLDALLTHIEPGYNLPGDNNSPSGYDFAACEKLLWWRFSDKETARAMRRHRARHKTIERGDYLPRTITKASMRVGGDVYCESVTARNEEREYLEECECAGLRDYIPTCPVCDAALGDHTRLEFDPLERVCSRCNAPFSTDEVYG